jgi:hypothetical protein
MLKELDPFRLEGAGSWDRDSVESPLPQDQAIKFSLCDNRLCGGGQDIFAVQARRIARQREICFVRLLRIGASSEQHGSPMGNIWNDDLPVKEIFAVGPHHWPRLRKDLSALTPPDGNHTGIQAIQEVLKEFRPLKLADFASK